MEYAGDNIVIIRDEPNEEESKRKLSLMHQIANVWRSKIYTKWAPIDRLKHNCSAVDVGSIDKNVENMYDNGNQNIPNEKKNSNKTKNPDFHSTSVCEIAKVPAKLYESTRIKGNQHLCVFEHCLSTDPELHTNLILSFDDIYMCKATGKEHFCGEFCNINNALNNEKMYVCPISGITKGMVEMRDKFWSPDKKIIDKDTTSNPYSNSRCKRRRGTEGFDARDIDALIESCSNLNGEPDLKKRRSDTNLKTEYFYTAVAKLSAIFSPMKFEQNKKRNEGDEKEIKTLLNRHTAKFSRNGGALNTSDLHLIAVIHRKKKDTIADMTKLSKNQRKTLIIYYAKLCVILWSIIRTKTRTGRESPGSFPWSEFIGSALQLFETGFEISQLDNGCTVQIIEQDTFLSLLPDESSLTRSQLNQSKNNGTTNETQNTMSSTNNSQKKGNGRGRRTKKNNQTKVKNNITTALISAILHEDVSPHELRPDSVEYDDIRDDIFVNIKGRNANKKK